MRCAAIVWVLLAVAACNVDAIVVVAPVVYVASLSLLSVILKVFVAFFVWAAVQGAGSRRLLGRPAHSIVAYVLAASCKAFIAIALATTLCLLARPITLPEIATVAAATGLASFGLLVSLQARMIRNSEDKFKPIANAAVYAALVFILVFASIRTSVNVTLVSHPRQANVLDSAVAELGGIKAKVAVSGMKPAMGKKESRGDMTPTIKDDYARTMEPAASIAKYDVSHGGKYLSGVWVVPRSGEPCVLTISSPDGTRTVKYAPEDSCLIEQDAVSRTWCPIRLNAADIRMSGPVVLSGAGSCSGRLKVQLGNDGLRVIE
jgi:hypothetical protein